VFCFRRFDQPVEMARRDWRAARGAGRRRRRGLRIYDPGLPGSRRNGLAMSGRTGRGRFSRLAEAVHRVAQLRAAQQIRHRIFECRVHVFLHILRNGFLAKTSTGDGCAICGNLLAVSRLQILHRHQKFHFAEVIHA
jgi:hypothetical protein